MIPSRIQCFSIAGALCACICALLPSPCAARASKEDLWRTSEALVARLGAEWHTIGILKRDLASIGDVTADLRNLQLFPEELTRLNEKSLVEFDKRIESIEKRQRKIAGQVGEFSAPLSDAVMIVREMTVDKPVKDMLEILEEGDLKRINSMLALKHEIDQLWKDIDSLAAAVNTQMGLPPFEEHEEESLDREFFAIIRANLGTQSDEYYATINRIKDSLVLGRSNDAQRKLAFDVEMHLINTCLKQNNWTVALKRVLAMEKRYRDEDAAALIQAVLARIYFALGDFTASLESAQKIPAGGPFDTTRTLYAVQSLYAMQEYARAWEWCANVDFAALKPKNRNLLVWLAMESGLASGVDIDYSTLAGMMVKDAGYHLQILHALARSYVAKRQYVTAISVLESALLVKPRTDMDRKASRRILLTLAQVHFENGDFNRALKCYFDLLADEEDFEEALYGMAWCYIRLGNFPKAETTLRTLINQNPSSPLAAEAILLMSQRYLNKAQYDWKKSTYLAKEYARLQHLAQRLAAKAAAEPTDPKAEKYRTAITEVNSIMKKIEAENSVGYADIAADYAKAQDICKLVQSHYETGSFQEAVFSASREKLLHVIDSLLIAIQGQRHGVVQQRHRQARARQDIEKIKRIVQKSVMLSVEGDIDRYRWEREYLEWQKSELAEKIKTLDEKCRGAADSGTTGTCAAEKHMLAARMDSLINAEERIRDAWHAKLVAKCNDILRTPLDTADEIYIRYHLGELYYAKENETFAAQHEEYEKKLAIYQMQLALFREGTVLEMPVEPQPPKLNHDRSMQQYRMAIRSYPNHPDIAPVLYSLAWCFTDLGQLDSAVATMTLVASVFPACQYAPQAWMYLGEYYFDNGQLDKAIEAYQAVMKYPESEWFDEALYKIAWAHYRKSNPGKAISSFLALVELGEGEMSGKALLEKESMDYIAISFSESDPTGVKGLEQAVMFAVRLGDEEKGTQILHRLAGVYKQQGRFDLAKSAYQKLLQKFPLNKNSPLFESDYLKVRERDATLEETCQMKKNFFEKYNRESEWSKKQKDAAAIRSADSLAAGHLYDAAVTYHQLAMQQGNNRQMYLTAAETYENYIRTYPQSPLANECHYNFAEIHFSLGNYQRAAEEYMAVSKRYPTSKFKETAAWNAIVASQNLLKEEEKVR